MFSKMRSSSIQVGLIVVLLTASVVLSDDNVPIPADKAQVRTWFNNNVRPLAQSKSLDPGLVAAEAGARVVKVMQDGSGNFKTITDAIKSIPIGNTKRVIIYIGGGNYHEKIKIERTKPFVTFYGAPGNMPNLTYGGTAQQYGTVDSATLIVESDYFVASNIIISNSAPRPDGKRPGAQAVALRISGDKAAFYNCKFFGFQDTICDDRNRHFFKNCFIQGTVDFIFGSGKSLYLNTELRVLGDNGMTVIVAQARKSEAEDSAYSFVHCHITGTGTGTYLGRAWMSHPKVIFAYTTMSNVINKAGWSNNNHPEYDRSAYFGEYQNKGPGADVSGRASITKKLSFAEVKPYVTLGMLQASKWLLPPPRV
ncbi:pectinesterase PPME1-like [Gastrolobium bilobum]|uniref:pectinesterase PPME1-like n=1 Tax=Gastrolobium bilobum TaxID=150636 RepID=UPI002AB1F739|nr:pectinesterase PPME1-like [Gastrolobium bilobum]